MEERTANREDEVLLDSICCPHLISISNLNLSRNLPHDEILP
jgi:hypothetical protein